MSSTALAAIGRGYVHTYTKDREDLLDSIWKGTQDTSSDRMDPPFNNMFNRLTAIAEHLHTYLTLDNEAAGEWFAELKEKTHFFGEFYATQAIAEALEDWKTHLIYEQSKEMEDLIKCAIVEKSRFILMHVAEQMGITIPDDPLHTPCRNPLCAVNAAKHTTDPSPVQRGRQCCPPSQPPHTLELAVIPPTQCQPPPTEQLDLLKVVKEAIGPVLARFEALEKQTMPLPLPPTIPPHLALAETSATATCRTQSRPLAYSAAPAAADPTAKSRPDLRHTGCYTPCPRLLHICCSGPTGSQLTSCPLSNQTHQGLRQLKSQSSTLEATQTNKSKQPLEPARPMLLHVKCA